MGDSEANKELCHMCGGGKTVTCPWCKGTGQEPDPANPGSYINCRNGADGTVTCPRCNGSGWEP